MLFKPFGNAQDLENFLCESFKSEIVIEQSKSLCKLIKFLDFKLQTFKSESEISEFLTTCQTQTAIKTFLNKRLPPFQCQNDFQDVNEIINGGLFLTSQ
jgi:hypothetical protein